MTTSTASSLGTDFTVPAAVYAYIRRHGQVTLGNPDDHLVRRVRALASRDGIAFAQYTERPGGQRRRSSRTVSLALHDGDHNLVFPDAAVV